MSNPVAQCTHIKTNGEACGSPAVSGTELCYHHSKVKSALGKPIGKAPAEGFAPIPFLFPEDRASMQINFFLLLQAYNEQRIDQRTYRVMLSLLKSMARNLGRMGSLVELSEPTSQKRDPSASSGQVVGHPGTGNSDQGTGEPTSQKQDVGHPGTGNSDQGTGEPTSQKRDVGHPAAKLRPEACFMSAVPASARPAYLSMEQAKSCVR